MRKFYLLGMLPFLLTSCSNSVVEEDESLSFTPLVSGGKTISIGSTDQVECYDSLHQTRDLQIILSEPLANNAILSFNVYEYNHGWNQIPGEIVSMNAGESQATVETSCYLPDYVPCGEYTDWYSRNYKFVLDEVTYIGGTWDYTLSDDGTELITAYKYCLGGGWTDPGNPGGLN